MMTNITSNKVLQEIVEKTNASTGMYVQRVYKATLQNLLNIFSNIYYLDRNNNPINVKCIPANQERAVAKLNQGNNITLPLISISENTSSNSDSRRRYNPILVSEKFFSKSKNRAIRVISMAPRPVDITYSVNIWSKYMNDLDQIREHIYLMFNPDLEIRTKDSFITKAYMERESPIEEVEANDSEDRNLKKSFSIKIETYIENPKFLYTSTGKIESFNYELDIVEDVDSTN
jgi:ribosomal protein L28